jgi:hypothetical protein
VLDVLVQARRDAAAARKLMRELLRKQGITPTAWVTDKCPARRFAIWAWVPQFTSGPSGKTTGPKAHTFQSGDGSISCNGSNRPSRRSGSCRCTPRPTTPSTFAVISPPPAHTNSSEPRRSRHGGMQPASRPEPGGCRLHRGTLDNVTSPPALLQFTDDAAGDFGIEGRPVGFRAACDSGHGPLPWLHRRLERSGRPEATLRAAPGPGGPVRTRRPLRGRGRSLWSNPLLAQDRLQIDGPLCGRGTSRPGGANERVRFGPILLGYIHGENKLIRLRARRRRRSTETCRPR